MVCGACSHCGIVEKVLICVHNILPNTQSDRPAWKPEPGDQGSSTHFRPGHVLQELQGGDLIKTVEGCTYKYIKPFKGLG